MRNLKTLTVSLSTFLLAQSLFGANTSSPTEIAPDHQVMRPTHTAQNQTQTQTTTTRTTTRTSAIDRMGVERVEFGVQAGANYSSPWVESKNFLPEANGKLGGAAGALAEFSMNNNFALQPELNFLQSGYRDEVGGTKTTHNLNFLELALLAKGKIDVEPARVFVLGGLSPGMVLSQTTRQTMGGLVRSDKTTAFSDFRLNAVLGAGAEVDATETVALFGNIRTNVGLTNMLNSPAVGDLVRSNELLVMVGPKLRLL